MINVKVNGIEELRRQFDAFSDRRFAAAVATALTRTAVSTREAVKQEALRAFDAPTPYTLSRLRYVGARADRLYAVVGFDIVPMRDKYWAVTSYRDVGPGETPAGKYLRFQADGGTRRLKRFEKALQAVGAMPQGWVAVPGEKAKIDAYGNHSPAEIRQILSWFDAAELVAGSRQNMGFAGRERRMRGTRKTAGWEYFVVAVGDRRSFVRSGGGTGTHKMQPGIYRRTMLAMGTRIEPVMIFVREAQYAPRFRFDSVAHGHAQRMLPAELRRSFEESAQRLAARGSA